MPKPGRPFTPKKDQRTERINIPVTKAEYDQINAAVEASGFVVAAYCRKILLDATAPKGKK